MTNPWRMILLLAGGAAALLLGGCTTAEMKGTPFYNGEYSRLRGPAEQRVNVWPIFYYRDPALSVFWPVFELTEDHAAVRPLFSVYGLDKTNRDYSVLWPLNEFDLASRDYRIFPAFWGDDYRVLFPLYWHFGNLCGHNGGTDSLFPAYLYQRDQEGSLFASLPWMSGSNTKGLSWQLLTPFYFHEAGSNHAAFVTPLWAQGHSATHDWKSLVPLVYWDRPEHTVLSPLWAHWKNGDDDAYVAPWAFSWAVREPGQTDLWLAGCLAHASWGTNHGSHYAFPFYYRDASESCLVTPFFGWDRGESGFVYPFTPLVGEWTGREQGSWVFPLYSHARNTNTGNVSDTFLLLGGRTTTKSEKETWFFPVFCHTDYGPLGAAAESTNRYAIRGREFLCFPYCWYGNEVTIRSSRTSPVTRDTMTNTPAPLVKDFNFNHGAFPLWSYEHRATPAEKRDHTEGSLLLWLYDYKHEIDPPSKKSSVATNDYTRARILWRAWHYERRNGDVSVDAFPGFTYDHKTDGFKKTSLLWHLFRYERSPQGDRKLDLLFVPLLRQKA